MRARVLLLVGLVACGGATTGEVEQKTSTSAGKGPTTNPTPTSSPPTTTPPSGTPFVDRVNFGAAGGIVYWTEGDAPNGRVRAARLDGTGIVSIADAQFPTGVAVDALASKVYWADNVTDTITRANLDGSSQEVLYTATDKVANPNGIAIDHAAGKLFWTESNVIKVAGLGGESPTTIYTGKFPTGVSAAAGRLAFTDNETDSMTLGSYSGAPPTEFTLSTDAFSNPSAVAIDADLFWAQSGGIFKMANDGSERVQVAAAAFPGGVAIEPQSHRIYFTDNDTDTVAYVNMDGSGRTVIYTASDRFANPRGVAIRP
jgi:DNA-binding beta-propeller fold protein YncE